MAEHLYVDVATLKGRLGITSDRDVQVLTSAVTAASKAIDGHCGRRFWADDVATARTFRAPIGCPTDLVVNDISSTTGLIVAYGTDGTYGTVVAGTSYELEPANGIGPDGNAGWPYEMIHLVDGWFPYSRYRRTVQITALWGWTATPAPVTEACAMMAADLFHVKDNRFGTVGVNDFGPIKVSENRIASGLLDIYRRASAFLSVA